MRWKLSPETLVALIFGAVLWLFLVVAVVNAQEAPPCPVWSVEVPEKGHTHMLIEMLPAGRVAVGIEDRADPSQYLLFGGPAYGSVEGTVCFDVDTVRGNPSPGAETTVGLLGSTICYDHQPDDTVVFHGNGKVMAPDPARTEEVGREVCRPRPPVTGGSQA